MNSALCKKFGIEFPLFAFTHCRDVVAEVSKAGGFGVLGAVGHSSESLKIELDWIDNNIDGKPYGVDLLIPNKMEDKSGDLTAADRLLDSATQKMFSAIRLVGAGQSIQDKKQHDFDERAASVDVLLKAMQRIARDKQLMHVIEPKLLEFKSKAAKAQRLKNSGNVDEGRRLLDDAYVSAKVAIEGLRGGETLVRSLTFANKKEEFAYELDRNDTHKMLVKVLLEEKMKSSSGVERMVNRYLTNAEKLRTQAQNQANTGNHAQAVKTMEQSTKEILKAIRSAGIYIPG